MKRATWIVLMSGAVAGSSSGQSLFKAVPPPPVQGIVQQEANPSAGLAGYSLTAVQPPKPRLYKIHDLVTIVIDETSRQTAEQSLKTEKKYDNSVDINSLIDPWALLELQLRQGNLTNEQLLEIAARNKFDGKGSYSRNDRFQMRIQAEIIDVKPNGNLVIEARKSIDKNGEAQVTVLSGKVRQEDITASNTILSTQIAELSITTQQEGEVDQSGKKGFIPRALERIFAF